MTDFDQDYYRGNRQSEDRPALWYYARLARRWLGPGPILDFGCGTGFLLRRLRVHVPVAGFEVSDYCRRRMAAEVPHLTVFSSLETLPEGSFSGVVALHVFEHLPDRELREILAKLARCLRPGGRVLCVMPDAGGRGRKLKGECWSGFADPTHVNLKTADGWAGFFEENGFRILRRGTDGLWDFPYQEDRSRWLNYLRYAWGTVFQYLSGRLVLPAGSGESVIFVLQAEN